MSQKLQNITGIITMHKSITRGRGLENHPSSRGTSYRGSDSKKGNFGKFLSPGNRFLGVVFQFDFFLGQRILLVSKLINNFLPIPFHMSPLGLCEDLLKVSSI